jgi:hypothetical protein
MEKEVRLPSPFSAGLDPTEEEDGLDSTEEEDITSSMKHAPTSSQAILQYIPDPGSYPPKLHHASAGATLHL